MKVHLQIGHIRRDHTFGPNLVDRFLRLGHNGDDSITYAEPDRPTMTTDSEHSSHGLTPVKSPGATAAALTARLAEYDPKTGFLDLSGMSVDDVTAPWLAQRLAELSNLSEINLSWNNLSAVGINSVLEAASHIRALNLSYNRVGAGGASHIRNYLCDLTHLYIAGNQLGSEGAKHLGLINTLVELNLSGNEIGRLGFENLKGLTRLTGLDVSFNMIGDAIVVVEVLQALSSMPKEDRHDGKLTHVRLAGNNLKFRGAKVVIPDSIFGVLDPNILVAQIEQYKPRRAARLKSLEPVQRAMERYVRKNGFPLPQNLLAKRFNCSKSSLNKIVSRSAILREALAVAQALHVPGGGPDDGRFDSILDSLIVDSRERSSTEAFREAAAEFRDWSRAKLIAELTKRVPLDEQQAARRAADRYSDDELRRALAARQAGSRPGA